MATYQTVLKEVSQQVPAAVEKTYQAARQRRQQEFVRAVSEQLFLLDETCRDLSSWEEVAARVRWRQAVLRYLIKK